MSVQTFLHKTNQYRHSRGFLLSISFITIITLLITTLFNTPVLAQEGGTAPTEDPQHLITTWDTNAITHTKLFSGMGDRFMRLDSAGRPHMAYGADNLYYAHHDGTNWIIETVDDNHAVGLYASLALDANNHPHISYYDANTGSLKYARNLGSGWEIFVLDTPEEESSFQFTDGKNPSTDQLPNRLSNSPDWYLPVEDALELPNMTEAIQSTTALQGRGLFTSIDLDAYGDPHIAYYDSINGDLKYTHKVYGGWRVDAIDTTGDTGLYTSLAVQTTDNKIFTHFSYYDASNTDLRYATWSEESTAVSYRNTVDGKNSTNMGLYTSIALTHESNPQPCISYYDASNDNLKFAEMVDRSAGDPWKRSTAASYEDSGIYSSLVIDGNNNPRISYFNATTGYLMLAIYDYANSNKWETQEVDKSGSIGRHTSMVLGADGLVRIGYYSSSNGELHYTQQTSSTVFSTPQVVDTDADLGAYNSLVFDSNGIPHIALFDDTHDDLYYMTWSNNGWSGPHLVDHEGDTGLYNDIAIDANNIPHMAYYNASRGCLRYAYWASDHWYAGDVECGKKGQYASIDIDSQNRPHISYYDEQDGNLKWAYNEGGIWKIQSVDEGDRVGLYTSLAIDNADMPHISYYSAAAQTLKYAVRRSTQWEITSLDTKQAGMYSSLALDNQGYPHIAYLDDYNEDRLKHVWLEGTTWNWEIVDPNTRLVGKPLPPLAPLSIAVDANNIVHIGYYDMNEASLRYARKANNYWQFTNVDKEGDVGQFSSIAVKPSGEPGITYYDASNGDLKYAGATTKDWFNVIFLPLLVR